MMSCREVGAVSPRPGWAMMSAMTCERIYICDVEMNVLLASERTRSEWTGCSMKGSARGASGK